MSSNNSGEIFFSSIIISGAIFFSLSLFSPKIPTNLENAVEVKLDLEEEVLEKVISKAISKSFSESSFMENDGIRKSLQGIKDSLKTLAKDQKRLTGDSSVGYIYGDPDSESYKEERRKKIGVIREIGEILEKISQQLKETKQKQE